MSRLCVAVVLGALVLPSVAAAKEVQAVKICGAAGCTTLTPQNTDPDRLFLFAEGGSDDNLPPAAPSPFYTVDVTVDAEGRTDSWQVFYIPAARMLMGVGEFGTAHWMRARSDQAFADAVHGLEPFATPEVTRAAVGSRAISGDPRSYLRLYDVAGAGDAVPQDADWIPIELRSRPPSPWTLEDNYLAYSPSGKLLQRGTEIIRLPDAMAADVEAARPIGADGRTVLPWLVLAGLVAALLALAALGAAARRRRRLVAVAVAGAALAVPGVASAKELTQVQICGPSTCTTIEDKATLSRIPGGTRNVPPPATAPFYVLRFTVAEGDVEHRSSSYYIPARAMVVGSDGEKLVWRPVDGGAVALMKRLARGVEPFPAPTISAVSVGGQPVRDPHSYLRLLEVEPAGPLQQLADDWIPIDFRSGTPSPWTDGPRELMYSPSTNMLERAGAQFPLAAGLAADIEARRALAAGDGPRWLPWLVLGALVLLLLALAGVARVRWASPAVSPRTA